ncbi:MAG TPA: Uma2 family endonuclease [Isosphaeraceae bacterium]|jgi:Uma2 family endonuclease|nr:Uma2 family endonuclease [Isosphaeraceae bacterium]
MATTTAIRLGPADHGRRLSLADFIDAEAEDGLLYELARGVVVVTEVPGVNHGRTVRRLARLFILYDEEHPGIIRYAAGGGECRLRLPGMQSDRHPDQAVYLNPPPSGPRPWDRWTPAIVVEVVSPGGEGRDYVEKREEYLRAGVLEYWVLDPARRLLTVLRRAGDVWEETQVADGAEYRTELLPGLVVRPVELLGAPEEE